ncbi:helix-turn-helix domain-containing protein [Streptomyces echinoruber]|uniref:HTH cro/C1-type domain-containing protein n=1 Tax=Streptomyces echinoruber TaxID=68898 RepID=A0A918V673_9ACTN|nr:helix-turn-helix transcriptional regulator [Streptomyces echinoruber]GGZ72824.1 hypothetical protein GCM10010389_07740 [Streptomyces echinoruber]
MNQAPQAVTAARTAAGLTKRSVARAAGFSEQLMCDIEAGRRNATPQKLAAIAAVLGCPVAALEARPAESATSRPSS